MHNANYGACVVIILLLLILISKDPKGYHANVQLINYND